MAGLLSGYKGTVNHARYLPTSHGFTYQVCLFLVDVDDTSHAFHHLPGWLASATSKWTIASYKEADHFAARNRGESLAAGIRRLVKERTGKSTTGRILLLTHLSFFGYCFNPAAFYYILKDGTEGKSEDDLECIVIEVTNTPWGEQHHYVLHPTQCPEQVAAWTRAMKGKEEFEGKRKPAFDDKEADDGRAGWLSTLPITKGSPSASSTPFFLWHRFAWAKNFHVSPFFPLNHQYDWIFSGVGKQRASSVGNDEDKDGLKRINIYSRNYQLEEGANGGKNGDRKNAQGHFELDPTAPVIFTTTTKLERCKEGVTFASSSSSSSSAASSVVWAVMDGIVDAVLSFFIVLLSLGRIKPNDKGKGGNNITPLAMARLVLFIFPLLTFRVQWWIHKEAVALFRKGVAIFPHPNNATSFFTDVVAAIAAVVMPAVKVIGKLMPSSSSEGAKAGESMKKPKAN
jgi:DUF1365 family protein